MLLTFAMVMDNKSGPLITIKNTMCMRSGCTFQFIQIIQHYLHLTELQDTTGAFRGRLISYRLINIRNTAKLRKSFHSPCDSSYLNKKNNKRLI